MYLTFSGWLGSVWKDLVEGRRVMVPYGFPHPTRIGFIRISIAEDHGQVADWCVSLIDGSRLHIHEYSNGSMWIHRDLYNPEKGPIEGIAHVLVETDFGKAVIIVGGIAGLFLIARALSKR